MIALVIMTGCTGKRNEMDRAMNLRAALLGSGGCSFTAHICADYGVEKPEELTVGILSDLALTWEKRYAK